MAFGTLSLKGRALRLLSQREHSRTELATKLARHVQEGDDLNAVLDDLQAKDFINANRVAESLVHRRAARLGTQRLVQELRSKGLDDELVRNASQSVAAADAPPELRLAAQKVTLTDAAGGAAVEVLYRMVRDAEKLA